MAEPPPSVAAEDAVDWGADLFERVTKATPPIKTSTTPTAATISRVGGRLMRERICKQQGGFSNEDPDGQVRLRYNRHVTLGRMSVGAGLAVAAILLSSCGTSSRTPPASEFGKPADAGASASTSSASGTSSSSSTRSASTTTNGRSQRHHQTHVASNGATGAGHKTHAGKGSAPGSLSSRASARALAANPGSTTTSNTTPTVPYRSKVTTGKKPAPPPKPKPKKNPHPTHTTTSIGLGF